MDDRRILTALLEADARPGRRHVRSERIVHAAAGDPGEAYDALVRMTQPWVLRYPLVDGNGNFGSVDGDPAAGMKYTAVRLTPIGERAATTSDVPELLINGASGIPPHNLREVVAAALALLDDPAIGARELMAHVPGPDFPTGGVIVDASAYETGHGEVRVRARTRIEDGAIVVTELPPMLAKGGDDGVIWAILELNNDGRIELADIQDRSDRGGMRLAIMPAPGADPAHVLETLFRHTPLETTVPVDFSLREQIASFLARADDTIRPRLLDLASRYGDDRRTTLTAA